MLLLGAALLCAIVVVVIPAIAGNISSHCETDGSGLIAAIITVIGTVFVAIIAAISAAVMGFFVAVAAIFVAVFRAVVKIVSLPFRICIGNRDPPSPLGNYALGARHLIVDSPTSSGAVGGQIRYVRDTGGRPPSYHSDEGIDPLERRK